MIRSIRIFLFAYAVAFGAVAPAIYSEHAGDSLWAITGLFALVYLLLAVGYTTSSDPDRSPSLVWILIAFLTTALMPLPLLFELFPERPLSTSILLKVTGFAVAVFACLGIALFLLRDFRSQQSYRRLRKVLIPLVLILGAACVFSSLWLHINDTSHIGWDLLLFRTPWITTRINVGTPLFFGRKLEYLQPFYAVGGYPVYLLALLASAAILVRLLIAKFSLDRSRASRLISLCAVVINLASLWVLTDIFWGWHFDLNDTPWAAILATVLWFAGPLAGAFLIVPLLRKRQQLWRLRAFLLFQIPIAAFNVMYLQAYFGSDSLEFEGLGMLIIGLLLESWACSELLAARGTKDVGLATAPREPLPHTGREEVLVGKAS